MMRRVVAVVAGFLVVGIVVMGLQAIGGMLYPPPESLDPFNPDHAEAFAEHMRSLPTMALLIPFLSEVLGAFLGAWTAAALSPDRKRIPAAIIVALALAASVYNWISFEHPVWFIVGQVVLYPLALLTVWRMVGEGGDGEAV